MDEEKVIAPDIKNWVTSGDPLLTDFDYGALPSVNPDTLPDIKATMIEFNQGNLTLTEYACTIVNSVRCLLKTASSYYKYVPKAQDVIDAVNYAKTQWYVVGAGWSVPKGVDAARKRWNINHPTQQINSYNIQWTNSDFGKLLKKGYSMPGSYRGSDLYNNDYRSDAILEGASFPHPTYGHCTPWEYCDGKIVDNDSYAGHFYNIYEIKQPGPLIANNVWNPNFYFFAPFNPNSSEIKRLTQIIADCTTQNDCASRLVVNSTEKAYQKQQNDIIYANNKKITQAKGMLAKL